MVQGNGQEITWLDELVAQVRGWHDRIIDETGGLRGEHTARLHAACARPFQSAFGQPIYRGDLEKSAALFHAIICDHAFMDGNKRTASSAALLYLLDRKYLLAEPRRLELRVLGEIAVECAMGAMTVDNVIEWFRFVLGRRATRRR